MLAILFHLLWIFLMLKYQGWQNQEFSEDVKMKFVVILTKKCPKVGD